MVKATHAQTFIGIWFHDKKLPIDQQDKIKTQLDRTFYYYRIFTDTLEFYEYLDEKRLFTKVFLIVSISSLSLFSYVKLALDHRQVEKVYIFLSTNIETLLCFNTTDIDKLFTAISDDINIKMNFSSGTRNTTSAELKPIINSYMTKAPPSFSVFNSKLQQATLIRHLTKECFKFASFLVMRNILTQRSYDVEELEEMCATCRLHAQDEAEINKIDELQEKYCADEAIRYYTKSSFLFRIINQVCGTENVEEIYKFRIYISDLHKKLCEMDLKQTDDIKPAIENVYRGKLLSGSVLQQLHDNKDGLISINGFLSTTVDRNIALIFAGDRENRDQGVKSTLFLLKIHKQINQPYAYIAKNSEMPHEAEVLFSLGTIWRIVSIQHDENSCTIELTSCEELDLELPQIIREHTSQNVTWITLGDILLESGDEDGAEWCYRTMLDQPSNNNETIGFLYYKIGMLQFQKKLYGEALKSLTEAKSLLQPPENNLNETASSRPIYIHSTGAPLLKIYTNIGIMLEKNGKYKDAAANYERALEEKSSLLERAIVHNNLGLIYFRLGKYTAAKEHHEAACRLIGDSHLWSQDFNNNLERAQRQLDYLAKSENAVA